MDSFCYILVSTKHKEAHDYENCCYEPHTLYVQPIVPLPNVATRRQFLHKVLDTLLIVFSGLGIAVMLLFFLTLI